MLDLSNLTPEEVALLCVMLFASFEKEENGQNGSDDTESGLRCHCAC